MSTRVLAETSTLVRGPEGVNTEVYSYDYELRHDAPTPAPTTLSPTAADPLQRRWGNDMATPWGHGA